MTSPDRSPVTSDEHGEPWIIAYARALTRFWPVPYAGGAAAATCPSGDPGGRGHVTPVAADLPPLD